MKMRALSLGLFFALAVPACAGQDQAPEEPIAAAASAATATKIAASEGDLVLTFDTMGTFEDRENGRSLILHATANRYLASVFSFVPDDAFGQASIISERRLEIAIPLGYELNSVLSGLPLLLDVQTFTGSPNHYTARIEIAPRFFDFLGSSSIWIDEVVKPIYGSGSANPLVYRGSTNVLATALSVTGEDGAPVVSRVDGDSFRLDWSYEAVHLAMDPTTSWLTFRATLPAGTTAAKTARLVPRVVGLALTSGDPYAVWPEPGCESAVYSCIQGAPAGTTDFEACGSYRQVARCMYANACDVMPPAPLTLATADASALAPAITAWNQGSNGGAWHHMDSIAAYDTPACPAQPVTIQGIVDKLAETDQQQSLYWSGTFTDRNGLSQSVFFGSTYGDGSTLLDALDAYAGGGPVQAWIGVEEAPCPNCHDWNTRAVLYYPNSGLVLVLDGDYGYDS